MVKYKDHKYNRYLPGLSQLGFSKLSTTYYWIFGQSFKYQDMYILLNMQNFEKWHFFIQKQKKKFFFCFLWGMKALMPTTQNLWLDLFHLLNIRHYSHPKFKIEKIQSWILSRGHKGFHPPWKTKKIFFFDFCIKNVIFRNFAC